MPRPKGYVLKVPVIGEVPLSPWAAGPLTILALIALTIAIWRWASADALFMAQRHQKELQEVATEYRKHLGESMPKILDREGRQLYASDVDQCLLEVLPKGRRLILPFEKGDMGPLAQSFSVLETLYAEDQGPRPCRYHNNERPVREDVVGQNAYWITYRWTFADACWALVHFSKVQPGQFVVDHQGCRHN